MKKLRSLLSSVKNKIFENPRPSLNNLDRKLEKYLDFDNGFFIEVGANDGYSQSNTYFLQKKRKWKGILVEGIPELFEKARIKRSKSAVYNCALVSNEHRGSTVIMHYANLMSVVDSSLKSIEEHDNYIKSGLDVQRLKGSYSAAVEARTLESILDKYPNLPDIDSFLWMLRGMN